MRKIDLIVVHCSDLPYGNKTLIDAWHKKRGWTGIGYHYVILNPYPDGDSFRLRRPQFDNDGMVVMGRDFDQVGAHALGYNAHTLGICLIGRDVFTRAQFQSLVSLIRSLQERFGKLRIAGHYELITDNQSPKTCPNLDMDYLRKLFQTIIK